MPHWKISTYYGKVSFKAQLFSINFSQLTCIASGPDTVEEAVALRALAARPAGDRQAEVGAGRRPVHLGARVGQRLVVLERVHHAHRPRVRVPARSEVSGLSLISELRRTDLYILLGIHTPMR